MTGEIIEREIDVSAKNQTDERLVVLTLENPENFKFLIERYEGKLSQYIRRKSNVSKEDIEDLLQNIFIKIYLNLNGFDTSLKFSSWAYRIAHNEIITWYRKKKIRPQLNFEDYEEENLINYFKEDTDLEKEFDNKDLREKIKQCIDQLDEKYKDIIILRFLEEKEYEEISDILEIPMGSVSTQIYRGRKELQKLLKNVYESRK